MATEKIFFAVDVDSGDSVKNLETLRANMKGVDAEIKNIERSRKRGTITAKEANKQTAALNVELSKSKKAYNDANKAAAGLNKGASSLTKTFNKVGTAIAGAFALRAVIGAVGDIVNIIKDFEQAGANLASVLGKNQDEIKALTEDAKRLGSVTAFTATQVSQLQTEFAKLGFTEKQILAATEATLALAAATGTDLAEAAAVAGATLGGFGLEAEETQRVVDVMAKSFSTSALDMEKFKESMKSAAPAARAVGISIEETTALLGTLSNAGIAGSKAGNNLKTSLINLNAAGLDLNEGLELVANSTNKLDTATQLVGKNAAASFLVLAEGRDVTNDLARGLRNAGGAADKMARTQLDTLEGKTKLLTSAWEGLVLSLDAGDGFISSISKGLLEFATNILGALTNTGDLADEFFRMKKETEALESEMIPLLDRHDELAEKSELSKDEQIELDDIILKIAEDIPTAITGFDEYGKAIGVSTSAARAFIDQQKRILELQNAEAIAEQEEEITKLNRALKTLGKEFVIVDGALKKNITTISSSGQAIQQQLSATDEEIRQYQDKKFLINTEIDDRTAMIAALKGQKSEAEKLADTEEDAIETKETEVKLSKDLIKEKKEEIKLADEMSGANENDIAIRNTKIEKLKEELKALQDLRVEEEGFHFQKLSQMKAESLEQMKAVDEDEDGILKLKENADREVEIEREKNLLLLESSGQLLSAIQELANVSTNNKLRALEKETSDELKIINKREEDGLLNEQEAEIARRKLKDESETKAEALEKKAFKRNKAFNLAEAAINTAGAVAKALNTQPFLPLGPIMAATAGALGAVQIATIASQKFAKGGIIQGNSHDQGGVPVMGGRAEVEGGEIILTKGVTSNPSLAAAANQLNIMGGGKSFLQSGGVLPDNFPTFATPNQSSGADISAIVDSIASLQVSVNVSEITQAQGNIAVVEQQSSI